VKAIGVKLPHDRQPFFYTLPENNVFVRRFIIKNSLRGKKFVGVHPGSGPQQFKRAPLEEFVKRLKKYLKKRYKVLIFGGPEEASIKKELNEALARRGLIVDEPNLKHTAALIMRCNAFVSNDSGLMNIACASKRTKVTTLFHGTNVVRTKPYKKNSEVVVLRKNRLKYPFHSCKSNV
jgi:heptosyltransferase-2